MDRTRRDYREVIDLEGVTPQETELSNAVYIALGIRTAAEFKRWLASVRGSRGMDELANRMEE